MAKCSYLGRQFVKKVLVRRWRESVFSRVSPTKGDGLTPTTSTEAGYVRPVSESQGATAGGVGRRRSTMCGRPVAGRASPVVLYRSQKGCLRQVT